MLRASNSTAGSWPIVLPSPLPLPFPVAAGARKNGVDRNLAVTVCQIKSQAIISDPGHGTTTAQIAAITRAARMMRDIGTSLQNGVAEGLADKRCAATKRVTIRCLG
jgi:hypothetical protein